MRTLVYIVWVLIPIGYFLVTLWNLLESKAKRKKDKYTIQLLKQSLFVSTGVLLSVLFDNYLLGPIHQSLLSFLIEKDFILVFVLPAILLFMSLLLGPTKSPSLKRGDFKKKNS